MTVPGDDSTPEATPRELTGYLTTGPGGGPAVALTWLPPLSLSATAPYGYRIYRADTSTGAWEKAPLNDFAVRECAYTDATVEPSHAYRYRVTAVTERAKPRPLERRGRGSFMAHPLSGDGSPPIRGSCRLSRLPGLPARLGELGRLDRIRSAERVVHEGEDLEVVGGALSIGQAGG